jgi:hypothetical protein
MASAVREQHICTIPIRNRKGRTNAELLKACSNNIYAFIIEQCFSPLDDETVEKPEIVPEPVEEPVQVLEDMDVVVKKAKNPPKR